ncbi:MAG: VWA domain-containing protein [Bacteroidota bacterium]
MFRFEHPDYLFGLFMLPILALLFFLYWHWRRRAIERFGIPSLMAQLMPEASRWKHPVKFGLLLLALAFLVIGWANPQWGTKRDKASRKSVDVFIALDISNSMLAQDIAPNRMERAKKFAEDLVEKLKGERLGVILFAGNAYLQMPLTTDYAAAQLFLRSANTELAGTQGTAIGEAIELARRSFPEDNGSHKALIIISDGEDHDGSAFDQATQAKDEGVLLFTVGVGTEQGASIPITVGRRKEYKRDENGRVVRSRLNEQMLGEVAEKGGGSYFNIARSFQIPQSLQESIDKMEKQEGESHAFSEHRSFFQYFIGAALVLLIIEFLMSFQKKAWEKKELFS